MIRKIFHCFILLLLLLLVLLVTIVNALFPSTTSILKQQHRYYYNYQNHHQHQHSSSSCSSSCTCCSSLFLYSPSPSSASTGENEYEKSKSKSKPYKIEQPPQIITSSPTQTQTQIQSIPTQPTNPTPKILILGSTGNIGKYIIQNLMNIQKQKLHVVAFVRDYDKACDVLYDEMIRVMDDHIVMGGISSISSSGGGSGGSSGSITIRKDYNKPFLQVIVMDLVSDEDVAGYDERQRKKRIKELEMKKKKKKKNGNMNDDNEEDDEEDENEYAVSASRFYNDNIQDYNIVYPSSSQEQNYDYIDPYQPLYDAMCNATAIISTIGTIRETLPFADYIFKPWRIFTSPHKWCTDPSHPYYVNYMVMKKVLASAEKEQMKRDNEWRAFLEYNSNNGTDNELIDVDNSQNDDDNNNDDGDDDDDDDNTKQKQRPKQGDKIRIIRITDLCVANPPWAFVTVLTNILRSLVFRSQERCEKLLLQSNIVDTIVLRPGDLVDDVRNETITALEVDINGYLPSPCYVGRQDVAKFATLAALSKMEPPQHKKKKNQPQQQQQQTTANNDSTTSSSASNKSKIIIDSDRRNPNSIIAKQQQKQKQEKTSKHWNIAIGWSDKRISNVFSDSSTSRHNDVRKAFYHVARKEYNRSRLQKANIALRNANPLYKFLFSPIQKQIYQFRLQQTKPYGIFVLLPMVLFVYPMICSIMYTIGKQIPIVEKGVSSLLLYLKPLWLTIVQYLRFGTFENLKGNANKVKKLIY